MPNVPFPSATRAAADGEGHAANNEVFVLDYLRTARGKASQRGCLHHLTALELVNTLQQALVERTSLDPAVLDDVVLGIASQVGEQGANLARTAVLTAGWPASVPGVTLNRFCASGIDAVATAQPRSDPVVPRCWWPAGSSRCRGCQSSPTRVRYGLILR